MISLRVRKRDMQQNVYRENRTRALLWIKRNRIRTSLVDDEMESDKNDLKMERTEWIKMECELRTIATNQIATKSKHGCNSKRI